VLRPRIKPIAVQSADGVVVLYRQALERIHLADPDGSMTTLLGILRAGEHGIAGLVEAMAVRGFDVTSKDVEDVISQLDVWGVLERDTDDPLPSHVRERHESTLSFYDLFSTLDTTSADFHRRAVESRVLLLGVGGVGSAVLQSLVGLGVGTVTIVDNDLVETKNLARQFTYGLASVGHRKVEAARAWAESYSTGTKVDAIHKRITDAPTIRELAVDADVVICAVDSPDNIHLLVNEACVSLGVPFVAGGLAYSTLCYWSVDPGRSPCQMCLELHRDDEVLAPALRAAPLFSRGSINRGTGPIVQLVSGLMSMEAMRFITRTDPPIALATYQIIELADGLRSKSHAWQRHPSCPMCDTSMEAEPPADMLP
jgi:molybdopterin/thiamine biosynthesis adenylyltransferase